MSTTTLPAEVPASTTNLATGAALGRHFGSTFTQGLYPALYQEATDSSRGHNGPIFGRGFCGGGNANGGHFRQVRAPHRPGSASNHRPPQRFDNLGNVYYLVTEAQRSGRTNSLDFGPDFGAQLVRPNSIGRRGVGPSSFVSPGSPAAFARSHERMGAFGAVSRAQTSFGKWKHGTARRVSPEWQDASPSSPHSLRAGAAD